MSGSVSVAKDDTLNTSFAEYLAFSLIFLFFLQVPHKFWGGTCLRQLYGAGAYDGEGVLGG